MPRHDDRDGGSRLYVGQLSSRTRSRDLEDAFSRYGRVRDMGVCSYRHHVVLVDPVTTSVEGLHLVRVVVSIVDLMGTGLEIAKLGTGRISVIDVGSVATLKEIVRKVQRKVPPNVGGVTHVHQVQGGTEVDVVIAGIIVTGHSRSPIPMPKGDRSPEEKDDYQGSARGSESS